MSSTVLVTGAAGFIGMHVSLRLMADGHRVVGVDNLNAYYDPALKHARLARLQADPAFSFHRLDLADVDAVANLFAQAKPLYVVHLAAQAGVRYAIDHPYAYSSSNLHGSTAILENCRRHGVRPGVRQQLQRLRRQQQGPVRRDRPGQSSGQLLRGHQTRQ